MDRETLKYLRTIENIDFAYFSISEIKKEIERIKPKSNLDSMIDNATGFGEAKSKELREALIYQVKTIIRNKKKLGYDYEIDSNVLSALTKLNNT
jgi:hypothetical protein